MKTHKLTKIGKTGKKLCKFSKSFLLQLQSVHPESVRVFLEVYKRDIARLGVVVEFDEEQLAWYIATFNTLPPQSVEQMYCIRYLMDGTRMLDRGMVGTLEVINFGVSAILSYNAQANVTNL